MLTLPYTSPPLCTTVCYDYQEIHTSIQAGYGDVRRLMSTTLASPSESICLWTVERSFVLDRISVTLPLGLNEDQLADLIPYLIPSRSSNSVDFDFAMRKSITLTNPLELFMKAPSAVEIPMAIAELNIRWVNCATMCTHLPWPEKDANSKQQELMLHHPASTSDLRICVMHLGTMNMILMTSPCWMMILLRVWASSMPPMGRISKQMTAQHHQT